MPRRDIAKTWSAIVGRSDPRQVAHQGLVNWAFGCEIGRETGGDLVGVTRRLGVATRGGPCGEIQELAWFQQLKKIHQVERGGILQKRRARIPEARSYARGLSHLGNERL